MSKARRILLAFGLFILVPAIYSLVMASISSPEPNPSRSISSASPSPSPISCYDIRRTKASIEEADRKRQSDSLNAIYNRQRNILLENLNKLNQKGLLGDEEWNNVKYLVEYADSNKFPMSPFDDEYVAAQSVLDLLLNSKKLPRYYDEQVVSMGEDLANTEKRAFVFVLENEECFDEFDILMAESFSNIPRVKSAWADEKNAADFLNVLTWRDR